MIINSRFYIVFLRFWKLTIAKYLMSVSFKIVVCSVEEWRREEKKKKGGREERKKGGREERELFARIPNGLKILFLSKVESENQL